MVEDMLAAMMQRILRRVEKGEELTARQQRIYDAYVKASDPNFLLEDNDGGR